MDFEFTEEQKMWQRTVRDFMDKEVGDELYRRLESERRYPYELYDKVAKLGWLGLRFPEEYGGMGVDDYIMYTIYCEATTKYGHSMFTCLAAPIFMIMRILYYGSEEMKRYYLPRFVKGELRVNISLTEPGAGSDAAAITTSAVADGDYYIINGQKVFSSLAQAKNNVIIAAVRTDRKASKQEGISMILVPNDTPGVEVKPLPLIVDMINGCCEVFFDNVRIPKKNLIGEPNKGWQYLIEHLDDERVSLAASFVGGAQSALDRAVKYAKERVQFGRPIARFQAINHMLADCQTEVNAARLMVYNASWLVSKGRPCHKESSMAKLFASEVYQRVTTCGMRVLGGYSFLPESDMERFWREGIFSTIGGGTSQIQRTIIAREMGL